MRHVWRHAVLLGSSLLVSTACGGGTPEPEQVGASDDGGRPRRGSGPDIGMDAEIGALDDGKVGATFKGAASKLTACFTSGTRRLPYLAGEIRFHVRVDQRGRASSVHAIDSTLGDLETEDCMIGVLEAASWPAPEGGREGIAERPFEFDPGGSTRPPVDLSEADIGKDGAKLRSAVSECRRGAGAGRLTVTTYIETDGTVKALGVAGEDAASRKAARCLTTALRDLKLASPGSYAGKLTLVE